MTVTWAIELDSEPVERVRADLLVAPHFEGDRPLRGAASRIDWRLCGQLSEMVARSAFNGAPGEVVLVVAPVLDEVVDGPVVDVVDGGGSVRQVSSSGWSTDVPSVPVGPAAQS